MSSAVKALLLLSCVLATLIAFALPYTNEDLFVALCSGRDTLNGFIGSPDRWSFTLGGRVWVDQSWLSHLIYYVSYLALHEFGPVLIRGLLLVLSVLLLYGQCRCLGCAQEVSLFVVSLATLSIAPFLNTRAHLFGMSCSILMTSVLMSCPSWGRWRQLGAVLVLAVWANCHGSFMLGLFLMALRLVVDLGRALGLARGTGGRGHLEADKSSKGNLVRCAPILPAADSRDTVEAPMRHDVWGWLVALAVAVAVAALCNPYGLENLKVPFKQLSASTVTERWVDWRPLIDTSSIFKRGYFKAFSVLPFLSLLGLGATLAVVLIFMTSGKRALWAVASSSTRADAMFAVLVPIVLAPMVFRFQRMIVFAGPAVVPLMALLIQANVHAVEGRIQGMRAWFKAGLCRSVCTMATFCWLLLLSIQFYHSVIRCYSPGNPMNPTLLDRPLAQELMSYSLSRNDVVEFMRKNEAGGRLFTNEFLSCYLLFNLPDVRLFFDLRAQSVYPDDIIEAYTAIMQATPETLETALELLDRFEVSFVVLDTTIRRYFWLANMLMDSRKWGCIYRDEWVIILAKPDSKRFGQMIGQLNLNGLSYPRPETRVVTEAFLSQFMTGGISPERMDRLKGVLSKYPDPNLYSLIATSGIQEASGEIDAHILSFLEAEEKRLAGMDYHFAGGGIRIIESRLRILFILEAIAIRSDIEGQATRLREKRLELTRLLDRIREEYGDF